MFELQTNCLKLCKSFGLIFEAFLGGNLTHPYFTAVCADTKLLKLPGSGRTAETKLTGDARPSVFFCGGTKTLLSVSSLKMISDYGWGALFYTEVSFESFSTTSFPWVFLAFVVLWLTVLHLRRTCTFWKTIVDPGAATKSGFSCEGERDREKFLDGCSQKRWPVSLQN